MTDANTQVTRAVLVGHCLPDRFMLKSTVEQALPEVKIEAANDESALETSATADALLLVNRVLDGDFDSEDGVALIRRMAQQDQAPAMLLVTNRSDAQEEAAQAGAAPGFGKDEVGQEQTLKRLREAASLG
jgi:DNA-binding NarL/FixJ family response regulator